MAEPIFGPPIQINIIDVQWISYRDFSSRPLKWLVEHYHLVFGCADNDKNKITDAVMF